MNPLFLFIIAHTSAKNRVRRCPQCGEVFIIPREKLHETVACPRCGGDTPSSAGRRPSRGA